LDLGHVASHFSRFAVIAESLLQVAEECLDQTWEFHTGGVQLTSRGLREHRPLDRHNILDHGKLMNLLGRKDFRGPLIFEIFFQAFRPEQAPASFTENLAACAAAKQEILMKIIRRVFSGFRMKRATPRVIRFSAL
jgi:hypothetical protein